ncbi:hypothetical protein C1708_15570 [Streptomyces sp. DH-12]|uniref:hypothetical protein n=1 Tax=Streptomyces sp. DH-12 TaxID=2072509 RepID=UPI000CCE8749|nr:hypothetical protein [Streptomyces sp. DH-12]PNV33579.1 hypothetical protein C1708_15570 [Streptomyces sp. DH-12]
MTSRFGYDHHPHSTGHVIRTVRTPMRTGGLDVSLTAIAPEVRVSAVAPAVSTGTHAGARPCRSPW